MIDSEPSPPTTSYRIALILPDLRMGGAERDFLTLADGFSKRGYLVDLVVVRAVGPFLLQVPENVCLVNLNVKTEYHSFFPLIRYLRKENPHILLSTLDLMSMVSLIARFLSGSSTKVLVREASTASQLPRPYVKKVIERILMQILFPRADAIVAVSQGVTNDLCRYANIDLKRIRRIYNPGVTPQISGLAERPVDHPWFLEGHTPVIVGMGRLVSYKNYSLLIRAFSIVAERLDVRLVIFGEGEQRDKLEALAEQLGIKEKVSLPGFTPNPFAYLYRANAFVLSSDLEGLPNVIIQAMACGCPVISTDCHSGPRELLADGRFGKLVPVGDVTAMAEAIAQVLSGDSLAVDPEYLKEFDSENIINQYLRLMELPLTRLK